MDIKKKLEEVLSYYIIVTPESIVELQERCLVKERSRYEDICIYCGFSIEKERGFSCQDTALDFMRTSLENIQQGFWVGTRLIERRYDLPTRIFQIIWEIEPAIIQKGGFYYPRGYFRLEEKYIIESHTMETAPTNLTYVPLKKE